MKKILENKKLTMIIGISLIIVLVGLVFLIKNIYNKNNNKFAIGDETIVEKIKINDFNEITVLDSRIEKTGRNSSIFVKIKNNTNETIEECDLKLTIKDKDNKIILVSNIVGIDKLEIGDEREFQVSTANDISNAYTYIVEKSNKDA